MRYRLLALPLLLCACSSLPDWMGSAEEPKLKGERIAVISYDVNLTPSNAIAAEKVEYLATTDINLGASKTISVGSPANKEFAILAQPVIADSKIFTIDGEGIVRAFDEKALTELWKYSPYSEDDKTSPGGALTYAYGVVYATNGRGDVIALSADTGTEVWKKNLNSPIRRAVAVNDKAVFAATADNQLYALGVVDGAVIWRHSGSAEPTINYGSPAPAVKSDTVVVPYSSGEVFGINSQRGSESWAETLSTGTERRKTASNFVDVSATPVMADGIVYIASQNGNVIALNLGNGLRVWDLRTGAVTSTPLVVDKYIFLTADNSRLIAINRFDGQVKWVAQLPAKDDEKDTVTWSGPAQNNGKLYLVSNDSQLLEFDINSGQQLATHTAPARAFSAPVIEGGKMYILTSGGELVVY